MVISAEQSTLKASHESITREPISAFVICFNEEEFIADCLKSLSFCNEVIAIDSFSTDRTVEIAQSMGAKVLQRAWTGYRDQKAFGLVATGNEWVLNLDADERVSDELRENIVSVLSQSKSCAVTHAASDEIVGYYINRVVFYLGRWWRLGGWYPEYRLRLFKKSRVTWGGIEPHEKPIVSGRTATLGGELYHLTYRNMDEQITQLHNFSTVSAGEDFKLGRKLRLRSLFLSPISRFFKFYVVKRGYREGLAGFIVAVFEGFYTFMKYAKLWEHEFNSKKRGDRGA